MQLPSINSIDWSNYRTAYGTAEDVAHLLGELKGQDHDTAMKAAHELWCGLCHQHAYVSSAALPALPFLLYNLNNSVPELKVEILDILLGFAICHTDGHAQAAWIDELHQSLKNERHIFQSYAVSSNENIVYFARSILDAIDSDFSVCSGKA